MRIGITGATGQLGQLVIAELKTKLTIESLVTLVRNPKMLHDLGLRLEHLITQNQLGK